MKRKKLLKSEIMKIFNTTKETLRHYENLGLIEPQIDEQNYRYYDHKEIRRLRQIFYLRELEIPLEQIRQLAKKEVSPDFYLNLMTDHHKKLKEKMERQKNLLKNTENLLRLLKKNDLPRAFSVNHYEERFFYLIENSGYDGIPDLKSYYDIYSPLIDRGLYTERSFILVYPYENLSDPQNIDGTQCLELNNRKNVEIEKLIAFPRGYYLSVFYLFIDGNNEELARLLDDIEDYLKSNDLERTGSTVLEMEHPELSIVLHDNENIYELQIEVEKQFS